jgi:hypothetical protein
LLKKLDIVWTSETVSKLLEVVPPSTRRIPRCGADHQLEGRPDALVEFLKKVTK